MNENKYVEKFQNKTDSELEVAQGKAVEEDKKKAILLMTQTRLNYILKV